MYKKYGQRGYIYFCADVFDEMGVPNYRLDSDIYPNHTAASLRAYGHKKAWIMEGWRLNGKKVVLVKEAAKVEMTVIFDNTSEIRAFLEWLRFQSKRLKVPESQVLAAFAREWKAETLEIVIPPPTPKKGRPVV